MIRRAIAIIVCILLTQSIALAAENNVENGSAESRVTLTVEDFKNSSGEGSSKPVPPEKPVIDNPGNESGGVDKDGNSIKTKEGIKVDRKYVNKGYIAGYVDKTFGAEKSITREEFAAMLYRIFEFKDTTITTEFSDIEANKWSAQAVNMLASRGLILGVGDNKFEPTRNITREEVIAIIARTLEISNYSSKCDLKDIDTLTAKEDIARLYNMGIIELQGNKFNGSENASRGEVVKVLNKIIYGSLDTNKKNYFIDLKESDKIYKDVVKAAYSKEYTKYESIWEKLFGFILELIT